MEGAAHSAAFEAAEGEIGTAMRAVAVEQAVAALFVAEQDKILTEQLDRLDRPLASEFVDQRRRLPIHPHQLAGRRLRPDPGDPVVLLLAHHGKDLTKMNDAGRPSRQPSSSFVRLLNLWAIL